MKKTIIFCTILSLSSSCNTLFSMEIPYYKIIANFSELLRNGNINELKNLLDKNPKLANTQIHKKAYGRDTYFPINIASKIYQSAKVGETEKRNRYFEIIKLLVKKGANPNKYARKNKNALEILCQCKNKTEKETLLVIKFLVETGNANVNPFYSEFKCHPMESAIAHSNIEIIEYLISRGVICRNEHLHCAAGKSNLKTVTFLVEEQELSSASALHNAVRANKLPHVKYLVKMGANVNLRDANGNTPLHHCSNHKIAQYLIKNGANINAINFYGNIANPFNLGHKNPKVDLKKFFIDHGADIGNGYQKASNSILTVAIKHKNIEAVKILLQNGIKLDNLDNSDGILSNSILLLRNNRLELIELLVKNGAKLDIHKPLRSFKGYHFPCDNQSLIDAAISPLQDKQLEQYLKQNSKNQEILRNNLRLLSEILRQNITDKEMPDITTILENDFRAILCSYITRENFTNTEHEKIQDIKKTIVKIILEFDCEKLPTFDKIIALSYLAAVRFIDKDYMKEQLLSNAELEKCLKHIPFNHYLFHKDTCKYLRCRLLELNSAKRDINDITIAEALCNYSHYIPLLFAKKILTFFVIDDNSKPLTETGNLEGILFSNKTFKKNLMKEIKEKKEKKDDSRYQYKYLLKLADKIEDITKKNITSDIDLSYRNNPFHKKFVNSCTLFTILATTKFCIRSHDRKKTNLKTLPYELVVEIIKYTDGITSEIILTGVYLNCQTNKWIETSDYYSYLPSEKILDRLEKLKKYKKEYFKKVKEEEEEEEEEEEALSWDGVF